MDAASWTHAILIRVIITWLESGLTWWCSLCFEASIVVPLTHTTVSRQVILLRQPLEVDRSLPEAINIFQHRVAGSGSLFRYGSAELHYMGKSLHRGIDVANTGRNLLIHRFDYVHHISEFGKTINNSDKHGADLIFDLHNICGVVLGFHQ